MREGGGMRILRLKFNLRNEYVILIEEEGDFRGFFVAGVGARA